MASPDMRQQISQQLQRYDMAIKRVDDGIAQTKLNLVAQSQKLGQATQLAVRLHDKLVHDHQALLAEGARSNAMKKLRQQLAAKQSVVLAERQRLQVDALQLAEIEQSARKLLSPLYTPIRRSCRLWHRRPTWLLLLHSHWCSSLHTTTSDSLTPRTPAVPPTQQNISEIRTSRRWRFLHKSPPT